ncbi:hypothetical protein FJZ36_02530 [Candidatus Poribacteria bacterium]|nr:hypothetical protein [Candidatus Poribacteria bacterium]
MRTTLPLAICLVMGLLMLVQWFVPHPLSMELFRRVNDWMLTIGVFALVLGIGSLIMVHTRRVRRQTANWPYSVVVLLGLVVTAGVGFVEGFAHPLRGLETTQALPYEEGTYTAKAGTITIRDAGVKGVTLEKGDRVRVLYEGGGHTDALVTTTVSDADDGNTDGVVTAAIAAWRQGVPPENGTAFAVIHPGADVFNWIYEYFYVPLDSTMFSILAFFIASAAFRAFRARNLEATLLLLSACIIILGLTTPFIYVWGKVLPMIPEAPTAAKDWILEVPNLAMRRAIMLGVGLGSVAQAFRIIFGIERTYLGGGG